jgi:glycine C-acetyltransferase
MRDAAPHETERDPLAAFHRSQTDDLFDKCRRFHAWVEGARRDGAFQAQFRVELTSGLDHRITVVDPFGGGRREMICFDSNSYLGLHRHPRVVAAVRRTLDAVGYGTPSAQVLGGTNRWLTELEEALAAFHGRAAAFVFPSGYAANVGILTALLRNDDLVLADRFCHASILDGCRYAGARLRTYAHGDVASLERRLRSGAGSVRGRLIVTDGVFSMHGDIAPLPALRALADAHGARLMVDEAHSWGVLGATGGGIEEHYAMPGSVDVLMGTFSKAPGSAGGYVVGDAALIDYLRFFARSGLFTASLPAPICAGITEALRVMTEEPEHRARLWQNARYLHRLLEERGLSVPPLSSPIVPVRVGDERRLPQIALDLFAAGIKCGIVQYPAVPRGESALRLTVNARHTSAEIRRTAETLGLLGERHGLLRDDADARVRRAS